MAQAGRTIDTRKTFRHRCRRIMCAALHTFSNGRTRAHFSMQLLMHARVISIPRFSAVAKFFPEFSLPPSLPLPGNFEIRGIVWRE